MLLVYYGISANLLNSIGIYKWDFSFQFSYFSFQRVVNDIDVSKVSNDLLTNRG